MKVSPTGTGVVFVESENPLPLGVEVEVAVGVGVDRAPTVMITSGAVAGIVLPALEPARNSRSNTRVSPAAFAVNLTDNNVPSPSTPPWEIPRRTQTGNLPF